PALKYQALADSGVDVIDGYSTDGLLARYKLVTLTDDQHFFPPYDAAALVSPRIAHERPDVIAALVTLSGQLDVAHMREWNRRIEVDREDVAKVAREAVRYVSGDDERMSLRTGLHHEAGGMASRVLKLTGQH